MMQEAIGKNMVLYAAINIPKKLAEDIQEISQLVDIKNDIISLKSSSSSAIGSIAKASSSPKLVARSRKKLPASSPGLS